MSLRRLMKNYMSIQTSENKTQGADGAFKHKWEFLNDFRNVKCHIQEKKRQTVVNDFNQMHEKHFDLIYHQNLDLYNYDPGNLNQTVLRIIVAKVPNQKIDEELVLGTTSTSSSDLQDVLEIYTFKGHIEQVKGVRRRWKFFVFQCEKSNTFQVV